MKNHCENSSADRPRLTKADTVALWEACQWMESVLCEWRKDVKDEADRTRLAAHGARLLQAKRALRKVNQLRRQGL